jgi:tight adherence protein B
VAEAVGDFARLVKDGASPADAVETLAKEQDCPLRQNFEEIGESLKSGVSLAVGLEEARSKIDQPDFDLLVAAVRLQDEEIGGTPAAFDNLQEVIARRRQLRHLHDKTSTGLFKTTLWLVLGAAVALVLTAFVIPSSVAALFVDPMGRIAVAAGVLAFLLGLAAVRAVAEWSAQ